MTRCIGFKLDDGRKLLVTPGPGLMEFINGVRDADPTIDVQVPAQLPGTTDGYLRRRVRAAGAHRGFRLPVAIMFSLVGLGVAAFIALTFIAPYQNFQTLRSDLGKVHLPSGYHLAETHQEGTDCAHERCSLTQIWTWTPSGAHTSSAACADVRHAMASAFPGTDANSPIPAGAACDYVAILSPLFPPGQGERDIEVIVHTGQAQANDGFLIELTDFYYS